MQSKRKKYIFSAFFCVILVLVLIFYFKGEMEIAVQKGEAVLLDKQMVQEDGHSVVVNTYEFEEKKVVTVAGDVANKEEVFDEMNKKEMLFAKPEETTAGQLYEDKAVSEENSNVQLYNAIYYQKSGGLMDYQIKLGGGEITVLWLDEEVKEADKIYVTQTYSVDMAGGEVIWPEQFEIDKGIRKYVWQAGAYQDCWACTTKHDTIVIRNKLPFTKITVGASADIYVGNVCYKVRSEIELP